MVTIDDAIVVLTEFLIKETFEEKKNGEVKIVKMTKSQLIKFCLNLCKEIKKVENG